MGRHRRTMNINKPHNDNLTTRIIPGLSAEYQIVSLPFWAWFWLDDFMRQNKISYRGIYDTFGHGHDFNQTLHQLAELHQEYSMREIYNLANDNEAEEDFVIQRIQKQKAKLTKQRDMKLPKIYKLFGFMSCATTLEAVWRRRHYEGDSNKVK